MVPPIINLIDNASESLGFILADQGLSKLSIV